MRMMNGGEVVAETLAELGIRLIFANPGTTELSLAVAISAHRELRSVLVTQELVATGSADGAVRMGADAAALLHLGPGFANGAAFLHNARRAGTPLVVLVGEHPERHRTLDPALATDLDSVVRPFTVATVRLGHPEEIRRDIHRALGLARERRGPVAVIAPSDLMDSPAHEQRQPVRHPEVNPSVSAPADPERPALLLLGAGALTAEAQRLAAQIAAHIGGRCLSELFPARMERGGGLPFIPQLAYFAGPARAMLSGFDRVVTVGAREPVSYFDASGKSSHLIDPDAEVIELAAPGSAELAALQAWASALGKLRDIKSSVLHGSKPPSDLLAPIGLAALAHEIVSRQEEDDVVVSELRTSGTDYFECAAKAPRHTFLGHPGGAIGEGVSLGVGAAIATGRRVLCLVADGGFLYAPQALAVAASANLELKVLVAVNRGYRILRLELEQRGFDPARAASDLTTFDAPFDLARLAEGFGVPATRVATVGALRAALDGLWTEPGPSVVVAELADQG
jgi:acetolactate synthase-1/2/3 large subunit